MRGKPSPRSCLFFAIAVGFAVSLAIELTQVWLPGRDSSLLDRKR
jgi:VanZ family protein